MTFILKITLQPYNVREVKKASLARQRTSIKVNI